MENRITRFFKNMLARAGKLFLADPKETLYKELGENVDFVLEHKIDDIELAVKFDYIYQKKLMESGIRQDYSKIKKYETNGMYPLKTKLTKEQALELAGKFFESVFPDQKEHFLMLLNGEVQNSENQKVFLNLDETGKTRAFATSPDYPSDDVTVNVPLYGDLRDLYTLVHEISHTLDTKNGANETRSVLGEIVPQAMERALDDFLDTMPLEDREKYGFDLETLEQDIKDRRLATFVNRLNIIKNLPRRIGPDKMESSRYMLAQIYQPRFTKIFKSPEQFGQEIMKFAKAIEKNNMAEANSIVGIDLNPRKNLEREGYIESAVTQFLDEVNGKVVIKTNEDIVSELEEKYKDILATKSDEDIKEAFEVWNKRKEQVRAGKRPVDGKLKPGVAEIFALMDKFKHEAKEALIGNDVTLTHITSISPDKMYGRIIKKSTNRANTYETDIVDAVFASSKLADGTNPYIARNKGGMILLGSNIYVFGGDNIDVKTAEDGKSHAILKKPNYAYFINPKTFEPVVGLKNGKDNKPYFEFSNEWISNAEMSLTDSSQVYGYKTIIDISDLLKNYQVFSEVSNLGLGMQILNMKKEDASKFVAEQVASGNLKYINGEAKINEIGIDKMAEDQIRA